MMDEVRAIREGTGANVSLVEAKPNLAGTPWLEPGTKTAQAGTATAPATTTTTTTTTTASAAQPGSAPGAAKSSPVP
jgi:hypothetical protein